LFNLFPLVNNEAPIIILLATMCYSIFRLSVYGDKHFRVQKYKQDVGICRRKGKDVESL